MSQISKDGSVLMKITVPARVDKKMGMGVIHSKGNVFISSIHPGSLAAEHFQIRDRIVSINGVNIKDKKHCKELILSASTESEFDVMIERRKTSFQLPVVPQTETDVIPDLSFMPEKPRKVKSPSSISSPKSVSSPPSSTPKKLPPPPNYQNFYLGDDEFAYGDPLDGLIFPAPVDVRNILQLKVPQILKDFMSDESEISKRSQRDSPSKRSKRDSISKSRRKGKTPSSESIKIEDKNVTVQTIASDVPRDKQLMKPKHH